MAKHAMLDKDFDKSRSLFQVKPTLPDEGDILQWTQVIKRRIMEKINYGNLSSRQWLFDIQQDLDEFLFSGNIWLGYSTDYAPHVSPNVTLLSLEHNYWSVNYLASPLDAYFPISVEDRTINDLCYLSPLRPSYSYCRDKLKKMVQYVQACKERIQFSFVTCQLHQFKAGEDRFHVVHCSDTGERIGLANILPVATNFLLDKDSVLVLEVPKLPLKLPTVAKFVEFSLRCPISMMPTVYGFRLANHVELGSPVPVNFHDFKSAGSIKLLWHKAAPFSGNMKLGVSSELIKATILLAKCCFTPCYTPNASEVQLPYTPLTFFNVVHSLLERCGWIRDYLTLQEGCSPLSPMMVTPFYRLAWKTYKDFLMDQPVLVFTATRSFPFKKLAKLKQMSPVSCSSFQATISSATTRNWEKCCPSHFSAVPTASMT